MSLENWITNNQEKFDSPFELMFVEKVLAFVEDLELSTVQAQYEFYDLDGQRRFCDFVLKEGNIRIAIEIDGYDKRNTGQGMTHEDFIDWQRRQAALTAEGWHVLRFANRDVRDNPERCRRYIELLLQDQRSKSQHQLSLEAAITEMGLELQKARSQVGTSEQIEKLNYEIGLLKRQLTFAKNAHPLSETQQLEKQQLVNRLEQENRELKRAYEESEKTKVLLSFEKKEIELQGLVLDKENKTMRTTVWAFTVIIALLIVSGAYVFVNSDKVTPVEGEGAVASTIVNGGALSESRVKQVIGPSCDQAIPWFQAKEMDDQIVTVSGVIVEYAYMPKVNGQPTWINIGGKYPNKNRLSIVVWGDDRQEFASVLSDKLVGRKLCVMGRVKMHNGVPQIALKNMQELILP